MYRKPSANRVPASPAKRIALIVSLAVALSVSAPAGAFADDAHPDPTNVERLAGSNRYETMSAVVGAAYPSGSKCDTAVVATGSDFPDALSGSALAGLHSAPVVITSRDSLDANASSQLKRLGVKNVYVLGGTPSVSNATVNQIKKIVPGTVKRVSGADRIETAERIFEEGRGSWGKTAIIATGAKPSDALSIATYAYSDRAPVFLASGGNLTSKTKEAIAGGGFDRVLICGDGYAVSSAAERWCKGKGLSVVRFAGADRYDTNALIAEWLVANAGRSWDGSATTSAADGKFADALCASPLISSRKSVLILADDRARGTIAEHLHPAALGVTTASAIGDANTVSDATLSVIKGAIAKQWIPERKWASNVQQVWVEETRSAPETVTYTDSEIDSLIDSGQLKWDAATKARIVDEGTCCTACGLSVPVSEIPAADDTGIGETISAIMTHHNDGCPSGGTAMQRERFYVLSTGGTTVESYGGHWETADKGGWEITGGHWSLFPGCDASKRWVPDETWASDPRTVHVTDLQTVRTWYWCCPNGDYRVLAKGGDKYFTNTYQKHYAGGCYLVADTLCDTAEVDKGFDKAYDAGHPVDAGGHWE